MHEQRQHVPEACPLQGTTCSVDFGHSEGQRRLGQPGAQQGGANDTRYLPLLPVAKVSLVFLYNNEIRMELRSDLCQFLDFRVAAIASMPHRPNRPTPPRKSSATRSSPRRPSVLWA
jgi:hypothetical protein